MSFGYDVYNFFVLKIFGILCFAPFLVSLQTIVVVCWMVAPRKDCRQPHHLMIFVQISLHFLAYMWLFLQLQSVVTLYTDAFQSLFANLQVLYNIRVEMSTCASSCAAWLWMTILEQSSNRHLYLVAFSVGMTVLTVLREFYPFIWPDHPATFSFFSPNILLQIGIVLYCRHRCIRVQSGVSAERGKRKLIDGLTWKSLSFLLLIIGSVGDATALIGSTDPDTTFNSVLLAVSSIFNLAVFIHGVLDSIITMWIFKLYIFNTRVAPVKSVTSHVSFSK